MRSFPDAKAWGLLQLCSCCFSHSPHIPSPQVTKSRGDWRNPSFANMCHINHILSASARSAYTGKENTHYRGVLGVQCNHEEYLQVPTNALEAPQCSELKYRGLWADYKSRDVKTQCVLSLKMKLRQLPVEHEQLACIRAGLVRVSSSAQPMIWG